MAEAASTVDEVVAERRPRRTRSRPAASRLFPPTRFEREPVAKTRGSPTRPGRGTASGRRQSDGLAAGGARGGAETRDALAWVATVAARALGVAAKVATVMLAAGSGPAACGRVAAVLTAARPRSLPGGRGGSGSGQGYGWGRSVPDRGQGPWPRPWPKLLQRWSLGPVEAMAVAGRRRCFPWCLEPCC